MLMPKRVKRRKQFRGSMRGKALRGNKITYGEYGIVATEPAWITANQIEAARVAMTRYIKRGGKVWIKIFPDKPVTAQPAETRMGKGKGNSCKTRTCNVRNFWCKRRNCKRSITSCSTQITNQV